MPDDYYVSQYSGEEIDALLGGAGAGNVRYDAAQTLTDAQKAQARNNISAMQGIESTEHPGCYYVLNGSAVEWIKPPMLLGVEYRTTERYLGKPVYKKMIAYTGALTTDYSQMSHNIANIDAVCGCYAELFVSSTRLSTPRFDGNNFIVFSASQSVIIKQSNSDYSSYSARVTLSYTKSTD